MESPVLRYYSVVRSLAEVDRRDGLGPRLLFSSSAFSPSTPLWEPVLPRTESVAGQHPVHSRPQEQLTFMLKLVLTTKAIDDWFLCIHEAREGIQRGFIESLAQGDFKRIFHELARTTEGGVC